MGTSNTQQPPILGAAGPDVRILEDILKAESPMNVAAARYFAALELTPRQRAKILRLLDKNSAGTITHEEKTVLDSYARIGTFLSILRAKARRALSSRSRRR